MKLKTLLLFTLTLFVSMASSAATTIKEVGGWFESGYITWNLVEGASTYHVYCKPVDGSYTQLDAALVRNYGDYGRADVLGITAGNYQFKVVPVAEDGTEMADQAAESSPFEVRAHERTGFAFLNNKVPGGYKADGTLKNNAVVLYITDKNKDTITFDVITSSKGAKTTCTGFQAILNGFKKGYDNRPLVIRLVGQVKDPADADKGDIVIDMEKKDTCPGITLEGVGNDAVADGWGIRVKGARLVEIRNIGLMNCDSEEGDNIGLQQDNEYIWVHHCDLFYGHAGSDKDQAKGDGAFDCKKTNYVTIAYNHFWDSGKSCLLSNGAGEFGYLVTYHHNWFDHSDSRHPRVRLYSAHVYNNYFDGCSKYGVGATTNSSIFVESNYFRNTNKPMSISMQGSDINNEDGSGTFSKEDGGIIKSYKNVFAEKSKGFKYVTYQDNDTEFDAYEATSRDEKVPSNVVAKKGGGTYDNFDTNADIMLPYKVDEASDVPAILNGQFGAGRLQRGDFQWTFNNAVDDADYNVNAVLKAAVMGYKTTLVGIFGGEPAGGGDGGDGDGGEEPVDPIDPVVPPVDGDYSCYFTSDKKPSNPFYTITGSYSNSKGTATVNGTTYDWCLKMETKTSIKFTTEEEMTLTLVFGSSETGNIKIDGVKVNAASGNIITYKLAAGAHELTKADSRNLFYINLTGTSDPTGIEETMNDAWEEGDGIIYDLSGRVVKNPQRGIYIRNGKKIIFQ